jgi:hypothetical protein
MLSNDVLAIFILLFRPAFCSQFIQYLLLKNPPYYHLINFWVLLYNIHVFLPNKYQFNFLLVFCKLPRGKF